MGSRYGRKQKRQHRERIAALEESHVMDRALLDRASKRAADLDDEMRAWDDEISRLLGSYSALRRRTPEFRSKHPIREMPIHESASSRMTPNDGVLTMPEPARERMRRFVLTIDRDDIRMQRLIRFMETDGLGGVAYAISELALAQGFGRREIGYLATEIATSLARHFNSQEAKRA